MGDQRTDIKYYPVAGEELNNATVKETGSINDHIAPMELQGVGEKKEFAESFNNHNQKTSRSFLYIAACAANLAAFACGLSFGWTSPELPRLTGEVDPLHNPLSVPVTKSDASWIGSLLPVGAALGPFAAGMFADKVGRKKTLLVSIIPLAVAFIMFAYAHDVNFFFLGRFLCGLTVGGVFTVLPMYVGEIADDNVRGSLGSFMQLFITFGLLSSYAIGPYLGIVTFNLMCFVAPVLFVLIFLFYIPESPYFLIAIGDEHKAENSLIKFRSRTRQGIQSELTDIKGNVRDALENKANFFDIFKSKGLTKALILSVGLVALQQLSGINVVLFYTQDIFAATGSSLPPEICTIIIGVVQVSSSFFTPLLVDRMGKRFLLLFSAIGMGISEAVLGYYFYLQKSGENIDDIFWLPVLCLISYNITYCVGFGPLPWAVMGELFPGNIKSAASTVTASGCWILGFLITRFFGNITELIGIAGSFWIFSAWCGLAFVFVYSYLPETSGKSLQEIQNILNGIKSPK